MAMVEGETVLVGYRGLFAFSTWYFIRSMAMVEDGTLLHAIEFGTFLVFGWLALGSSGACEAILQWGNGAQVADSNFGCLGTSAGSLCNGFECSFLATCCVVVALASL